jgi:hypothetical protein
MGCGKSREILTLLTETEKDAVERKGEKFC